MFDDGAAYELMIGRWSALVAQPFLDWLDLPHGLSSWLDDGCGDGSFTQALVLHQRPASVVGVDPSPSQLSFARSGGVRRGLLHGRGRPALPLPDASVDAAVMALVLFFVPDPRQGVRELVRVVSRAG